MRKRPSTAAPELAVASGELPRQPSAAPVAAPSRAGRRTAEYLGLKALQSKQKGVMAAPETSVLVHKLDLKVQALENLYSTRPRDQH